MADGKQKPIEKIKPGEWVIGGLSGDPRRVSATKVAFKSIVAVQLKRGDNIQCTPDHLFMTVDHGWIEARHLKSLRVLAHIPRQETLCGGVILSGTAEALSRETPGRESARCDAGYPLDPQDARIGAQGRKALDQEVGHAGEWPESDSGRRRVNDLGVT